MSIFSLFTDPARFGLVVAPKRRKGKPVAGDVQFSQLAVRQAVNQLSPIERKLIRLTFGLGAQQLTLDEAAYRLGLSVRGAHAIQQRALRRLREILEESS